MVQMGFDEAKEHFAALLAAAERGEEVFIASKDGAKTYRLIVSELGEPRVWRQLGTARGLFTISDDFDDPLPEFDEYMQ